jgi:predicted nucleic acid-binding protein
MSKMLHWFLDRKSKSVTRYRILNPRIVRLFNEQSGIYKKFRPTLILKIQLLGSGKSARIDHCQGKNKIMVCFDTSIVIYIANGTLGEDIVGDEKIIYPSIVQIESLGYPSIRSIEEQRVRELLATLTMIPLTETIVEQAIKLRHIKKMSLGDAIVAATALENNSQLWTVNIKDFDHIDDLALINPLQK